MKPKQLMCILTISSLISPIPKPDMYLALTFPASRLINNDPLPKYQYGYRIIPVYLPPSFFSPVNDHQSTHTLFFKESQTPIRVDHVFNRHRSESVNISHPNREERAQTGPDILSAELHFSPL